VALYAVDTARYSTSLCLVCLNRNGESAASVPLGGEYK